MNTQIFEICHSIYVDIVVRKVPIISVFLQNFMSNKHIVQKWGSRSEK